MQWLFLGSGQKLLVLLEVEHKAPLAVVLAEVEELVLLVARLPFGDRVNNCILCAEEACKKYAGVLDQTVYVDLLKFGR